MTRYLGILAVLGATAAAAFGAAPSSVNVAGDGTPGDVGDGGRATSSELNAPSGVLAIANGIVIADRDNDRVRLVSPDGDITTVADVASPTGLASHPDGGFVVAEQATSSVRRIDPDGTSTVLASGGGFDRPADVAVTDDGAVLVADTFNHRIVRIGPAGVTTVAGTGTAGDAGDGGTATAADLNLPTGVAATPDGGFVIADQGNHRVRLVDAEGTIATIAGGAEAGFAGDGGPAVDALLDAPSDVIVLADGSVAIADQDNGRIRRVALDGTIATIAAGDLVSPAAIADDQRGGLLVADVTDHRVVRVPAPDTSGRLRVTAARTRARGARVHVGYRVSAAARVSLEVVGRDGSRVRVAATRRAGRSGSLVWNGRMHGRAVAPGRYTLVVTATTGVVSTRTQLTTRIAK